MMKIEFDRIGRDLGFGECAPNMWDEIERVYMGAERVSKEAICYAYWTANGYHVLKDAVDALDIFDMEGTRMRAVNLVERVMGRCATTREDVKRVVDEIANGLNRKWEREGVKVRKAHLAQVEKERRELARTERERAKAARAAEREEKRRERELVRQAREDMKRWGMR